MKHIENTRTHVTIYDDETPDEVVHFVLSGHKDPSGNRIWITFVETAREEELVKPPISGIGEPEIKMFYDVDCKQIRERYDNVIKALQENAPNEKILELLN